MKTIKVSKKLLKDKKIAEIFQSEIGLQLYLAIGTTHVRSNCFSDAILSVTKHIESMKQKPTTVEELRRILASKGYQDNAVRDCFPRPPKPFIYSKVVSNAFRNWEQFNKNIEEHIAQHEIAVREADDKIMAIVNALNGIDPWKAEFV